VSFEVFDLTVQLGPGLVPWLSAASRLGHVHGIPRRGPNVPLLENLLDGVYDYVDSVRFAQREAKPDLSEALGALVFGEPAVTDLFQATRGAAADRGNEVLVRILASPHMAVLPWELLPDPGRRPTQTETHYLTLSPDAHVMRLARGRSYPVRGERLEPPLNLLVVLSSPMAADPADDSLSFDIYEEKRSLLAELAPLVEEGLLHVEVEDHPTLENLRRRIGAQRRGFHLFHYLGHALPDALILEDEQGRRDDQGGARFMEILRLCPDLRLAVFAGCETARAAGDPMSLDATTAVGWRHMLSMADRCVQESCPVVLGMQAVLPFRTERLFTRFFYQGLAGGYSVAGALRLARGATRGDRHVGGDLLDWSVPVAFIGGADPGPLVDRSAKGKRVEPPPRHLLRLGLKQRDARFFGRDMALRQGVDILAANSSERCLIVTGPAGVGKTLLIDRALDELAGPIMQLYVRFDELLPRLQDQIKKALADEGEGPRQWSLAELKEEALLERLCRLVADLLSQADGRRRDPLPGATPSQWWPWLIEDVTRQRFVLAVDNLDLLSLIEGRLLRRLIPFWLAPLVVGAQALVPESDVPDKLDGLLDCLRDEDAPRSGNPFVESLPTLATFLGVPQLSRTAADCLAALVETMLEPIRWNERLPADVLESLRQRTLVSGPEEMQEDLRLVQGARRIFDEALNRMTERRSVSRLVLGACEVPETLLNLPSERRFVMRLGHLTWAETWRWIRRNLPGLLRYGEDTLNLMWPKLGSRLERWEELERRMQAQPDESLARVVNELVPPVAGGDQRTLARGDRPLRIAVAGPFLAGPDALAAAVTRLAAEHGIGGRVVAGGAEAAGTMAVLIDEPSPFASDGSAGTEAIQAWIQKVKHARPDLLLLDYGQRVPLPLPDKSDQGRVLLRSLRHRVLLIAAGGNIDPGDPSPGVTVPACFSEVLAVGPLGPLGLQKYAEWNPELEKPDLFMDDQLVGTALEGALSQEAWSAGRSREEREQTRGSGFAALHAAAAAILVWSLLPERSPRGVRRLLWAASTPIGQPRDGVQARALTIAQAVAHARRRLVRRTLGDGPCSAQVLAAITGVDLQIALRTLQDMVGAREVRRLPGRLERYELEPSAAAAARSASHDD
jgi:hypothetical protein